MKYAERLLFFSWRPRQESWELLLFGHYHDGRKRGQVIPRSGDIEDLYEMAVKDAAEWQEAGAKSDFL